MNRILFKKCNGSGLNKLFVFLLAILIFPECYGQTEAVTKRLTIIAGPSLLTVPNTNLGLQTGLQYNFARWSVLSEIAFPLYIKDKEMHSRFIRFSSEIKRYLFERSFYRFYISLQAHVTESKYHSIYRDFFFDKNAPSTIYYYDEADSYSHIKVAAIKTGHEIMIGSKFSLDLFYGIGLRQKIREFKNTTNLTSSLITAGNQPPYYRYRRPVTVNKTETKLHITTGFRLGFKLH
ncbi:MAG: DUF3575 domain-containing protein [Chitinophagaceae bacterium]